MTGEINTFPHREITDDETELIKLFWGKPEFKKDKLDIFLKRGGEPLLMGTHTFRHYMGAAMVGSLRALDRDTVANRHAFTRGAVLYAGVFQYLNLANELPVVEAAISTIGSLEPIDFVLASKQEIQEHSRTFCSLLEQASCALLDADATPEIAVIGAGAVHLAIIESDKVVVSPHLLSETHPELADLEAQFHQLSAFE